MMEKPKKPVARAMPAAPREALLRGLSVLEALNRHQVSRLETVATTTGLAKPTVSYMLGLLTRAGYVRRLPKRRGYTLDDRVKDLARGYRIEDAIVKAAIPVMTSFTTRYKWPLAIGTRDGNGIRVREVTLGLSPLAVGSDDVFVGRRIGFFHSALGRAYVGFCPETEQREILSTFRALTIKGQAPADIRDAAKIIREVARTGHAISAPVPGDPAVGLAVPIQHEGRVVACLSLRYLGRAISHEDVVRRYLGPLRRAADEIAALQSVG